MPESNSNSTIHCAYAVAQGLMQRQSSPTALTTNVK